MANLNIHASPLPFSNKRIKVVVPEGATIQEIVDQICPAKYKAAGASAIVIINGEIVLSRHWKRIRPKKNTSINVRVVPTGGGDGKNPLATLLAVVVMVAAPYAAAAYGAAVGTALGVSTAIGGALVSAGVGIIGMLISSALAPPPKPSNSGDVNNPAESPTQFIEGAQNSYNPFGVVPICLGTNRVVPNLAGRTYTETVDSDQYVRQLFSWGVGNKVVISDLKIGETALSEFNNYEIEHRLNGDLNLGVDLYPNDPFQDDYNILLQEVDGFTQRQTQADIDEAIVDFTFPRGLGQFNTQGKRIPYGVELEMQYALAGESPLNWSPASTEYKDFSGFSDDVEEGETTSTRRIISGQQYYLGYRKDVVVIDILSGVISIIKGTQVKDNPDTVAASPPSAPPIPENKVRIASAVVLTKQNISGVTVALTIESFSDDRQTALFGTTFEDSDSFIPSRSGTTITVSDGAVKVNLLDISSSQTEALRISKRIVFPENGSYLIRARRISEDTDSDQILDKVNLTAIKSFKYGLPVVDEYTNGTAIRMKATDQLNGSIDQFNAILSCVIPDYDPESGTWIERITSNPASIYRYVLQGVGNAKPVPDDNINIEDIEAWHVYCVEQNYTYNRVIDYDTTVDEVLRDVASAGAASPAIVDGKRTIAIDKIKNDIVQIVTPRNSWDYSGEMNYPDLPHAFRVTFRNQLKGYQLDERIVYDDGYNEDNATLFETLELMSCTDSDLAFKTARRHIASARLRPESHTFMMDVENLVALRGDRIKLAHDVPIIGVGDGRIKTVVMDGGSPNLVTGLTIDDTITIPTVGTYYVRVRLQDGSTLYKQLTTSIGDTKTLNFTEPFERPYNNDDSPATELLQNGDLLYVVEAGGEVDLVITKIEPADDLTARITAVDYAPEIFDAENTTIPTWSSNITTPLSFIRPLPPILLNEQSDESVMVRNSDGSYLPRAVFTLQNPNVGDVSLHAMARVVGSSAFTNVNILESTAERLILTGLQDGTSYDIFFRYKRAGGSVMSLPLQLNNYRFIGASTTPSDVQGFKISVSGETAIFEWDKNPEIDISHYKMEFAAAFEGAAWATAQVVQERIFENRISLPFQGGTYLIKAVDILGNESANATAIITYDPSNIQNVVEYLVEDSAFLGAKDNVEIEGDGIVLDDISNPVGIYYFDNAVDLGDVFTSFLKADIVANGVFINNLFDVDDIFSMDDVFGAGQNDIFMESDIFEMEDVFGIGSDGWSVQLQYAVTDDDPNASPVTWSDWIDFVSGIVEGRAYKFRIILNSNAQSVSPKIIRLRVTVDMPDRIERGEDISCSAVDGATVTYPVPFKNNPAVNITIQDGAADDKIEYISDGSGGILKTAEGFTIKVYNETAGDYVARSFDYISSGYGRAST